MGWNSGYTIYESTIINVYDAGVLTKEILNSLMKPYYMSDIDHGGCMKLRSEDGLTADEILCKVMEPERYSAIPEVPKVMPSHVELSNGKYSIKGSNGYYRYEKWQQAFQDVRDCAVHDLWREIVRREWEIW